MILSTNCHTRGAPAVVVEFTLPVLELVAVMVPNVPELTLFCGVARFV
jgi:hypothetical protein